MAEVIPQITIDDSKVKETWVQNEVVTNDVYNAINKAVINLKDNNNLLDSNSMLFREEYNSSSKNLNNAIHQGVYSFTNSAVNAPSGVNGGNLLVTNTSKTSQGTSIITQIAFCHNGAVYARTKNTSENFTAWNKLAYITDTISRATADKNGLQIDTGYLKLSGGTMNGNIVMGTGNELQLKAPNNTGFYFNNNGIGLYNWNEENKGNVFSYTTDNDNFAFSKSVTVPTPPTNDNSEKVANTSFVKAYAPSKTGSGASGTWGIDISGNANTSNSSTKATQDGDGKTISSTYLKLSGGTMNGNIVMGTGSEVQLKAPNNTGFYFNNNGIGLFNWNTTNQGNVFSYTTNNNNFAFNKSVTAPTPSTGDNSTRVATTAFVKSLFTANTDYTGWYKDAITGIVRQWGTVTYNSSPNKQVITTPLTFSKLLTCGATDVGVEIGTGNSFPNMDFKDGKLYIRPVYGDSQPSKNGVVLHWWIECLL